MADNEESVDALKLVALSNHISDDKQPLEGAEKAVQIMADTAVRTNCKESRSSMIRVLCASYTYQQVQDLIRDATNRCLLDTDFMDSLRDRDLETLRPWHRALFDSLRPQSIGKHICSKARAVSHIERSTGFLPQPLEISCRLSREQIDVALYVIETLSAGGWSHRMETNSATGKKTTHLYRQCTKQQMWEAYSALPVDDNGLLNGQKKVGRDTFLKLVKAATRETKHKTGVSYWLSDVQNALKVLKDIVLRLGSVVAMLSRTNAIAPDLVGKEKTVDLKELSLVLDRMEDAVMDGFYSHALGPDDECDGDVLHCTRFGFSTCSKSHEMRCKKCAPAFVGPAKIWEAVENVLKSMAAQNPEVGLAQSGEQPGIYDELVSMKAGITEIGIKVKTYHAHVLRGRWQQLFISSLVSKMDEYTMVLTVDYMMKASQHQVDITF